MINLLVHASTSTILLIIAIIILVPTALFFIFREKRHFNDENHDY